VDDFSKQKIYWSDISTEPSFTFVEEEIYCNNTCYMITGAPEWLIDYLNSDLVSWLFPKIATDLGGKGTRYFKQFVEQLPVPKSDCAGDYKNYFGFSEDEMKLISTSENP
jgi:hypothetical protein